MELGFVGTGTLTEAVVAGLRLSRGDADAIHLSPRSEWVSISLSARFARVTRAESNQQVLDRSEVVFLAFRPQQLDEGLAGLTFRPDHIVASFLAGVSLATIAARVKPAAQVCRVTPLPPIRLRKGPVLIHPEIEPVASVFRDMGTLIAIERESDLQALGFASGMMSMYFELQNAITAWLESRGVAGPVASLYVRAMLDGLAKVALQTPDVQLAELPAEYETKRGLNERARRFLTDSGWFARVAEALDTLEQRTDLMTPDAPRKLT